MPTAAAMKPIGQDADGRPLFWAEPGWFDKPGLYAWDGTANVLVLPVKSTEAWGAGDRSKWAHHGTVLIAGERHGLIYGEHPHSRQDNKHYVEIYKGEEPTAFDGHRVLMGVHLQSTNYLKSSGLSGDQIRKSGSARISADGEDVFEFSFRDIQEALRRADRLISDLWEHPSGWLLKEERDRLVGRKVFYREIPAVITRLVLDQGCVIVTRADGESFPNPVYHDRDDMDEREVSIKTEVLDPHIWWFRERE